MTDETTTEEKKPKSSKEVLVVSQLPTQPVNVGKIGNKEYTLITVEDALTEILNDVREIKKSVA